MSVFAAFGENEVELNGETSVYSVTGGSGLPLHYTFCGSCGNLIYSNPDLIDGIIYMMLAVFDDPHVFKPRIEIWSDQKNNWFSDDGCIVESFKDNGTIDRIQMFMENLDQRS